MEELFRKSATFPDDGRRRALAVTFFEKVLSQFFEVSLIADDIDSGGGEYIPRVSEWTKKVASVLKTVVSTDDTAPFLLDNVNTFFWWYVAPRYQTGDALGEGLETREDVMTALDMLNDALGHNSLLVHDRPEGEAAPGPRRQRTDS